MSTDKDGIEPPSADTDEADEGDTTKVMDSHHGIAVMPEGEVPTVDDDSVLQEELEEPAEGVFAEALAEAHDLLAENAHLGRIALYERELAALSRGEPDKARIALYQHEIGELTESHAGDEGAAVKAYARALSSDATLKPNLWAIRRVFERRQLWPNLIKLLDAEIRFARGAEEKAELLVEKGHLLEERLDDAAGARACYEKAVEVSPQSLSGWMALERLLPPDDAAARRRVWRGLADATHEPGRRVVLLIDLARAEPNHEKKLEILREALLVGSDGERVLDELERVAEAAGQKEELLTVLDERVARLARRKEELPIAERIAVGDKLLALTRRQAQVARQLGDRERAYSYLQTALALAPGEPLVTRELSEEAFALGRWEELADLLAVRTESAPPPRKIGLRLERAEALRRAGKVAEADALEAEVARDEPGHLGLLIARERAALYARDYDRLAQLYLAEAELANSDGTPGGKPDPLWAATALTEAAAAFSHLGRDVEEHKALTDALALVSHFAPAVDALERFYERTGKHADLAALCESELGASPAPERAERLLETLVSAREATSDFAGAAEAARRLCALLPADVRARVRLYELDKAAQRFDAAAEDLAELARLVPEERRVDVMLERADLLDHRLNDKPGAAAAYKEALELRPGDARAAEAFEALSRRRIRESGLLEQPSQQAWDDLATALAREAQASLIPERISVALLKLGEIHERERNNLADAEHAYRDLLERSPGNAAALRGLARVYRAGGDDAKLADALADEIDALAEGARAEALVRLGEHYEDRLQKQDAADDAYGRALALEDNPHAALGRLRTAIRAREPAALKEALARLRPLVSSDDGAAARAVLLEEEGELAQQAGDTAGARARADEAIALDGDKRQPRLLAARLAAQAGDVHALGDALEGLAERSGDAALRSAWQRRAGLLSLVSGSRSVAADAAAKRRLAAAHALTPSDATALVALAAVGAGVDALGLRARLAEAESAIEWHVEHGEALEAAGRLAEAAAAAQRALEADPSHLMALELKRRVCKAGGDERFFAATTVKLASEVKERERAAGLYREAALAFDGLGERKDAAAAWRALLDRTPLDGAAWQRARELFRELYIDENAAAPLVELYSFRLGHETEPEDRVQLLIERAELYADENDREAAERDLRDALASEPAQPRALRRLAEILALSPQGREEAGQLLRRYLEKEEDRDARRSALIKLAEIEENLGRVDEAVERFEQAIQLAEQPGHARAEHERLAQLYMRQRRWQDAVDTLRRLAAATEDGPARAAVEIRVAGIYREGFSDPRGAVESLMRALRADPMAMDALAKLMPLADAGHVLPLELEEKLEHAIDGAQAQAMAAPLDPAPYRSLVRLWGWRGDDEGRLLAAQAEALTSGLPPPSREQGFDPNRELSAQSWDQLWPETARSVALEIWRALGDVTATLFSPTLESLGVGKKDRVNAKGTPLAWIPVDKIARSLCGAQVGYELYAAHAPDTCVGSGRALVVGSGYADRLNPSGRYQVAYQAALLRERLSPLPRLSDEELALFFAAVARVCELPPPSSLHGLSDAGVEEKIRLLQKAIGRKERKAVQAIGARVATLPPPSEWRQAVLEGAARAGLAVAADIPAALSALDLNLSRDRLAQALVRFAVSDEFRLLRRDMGLKT